MGLRLNSAVIYGVQFNKVETAAFETFMENKPRYWLLMRYIEKAIKEEGKNNLYQDFIIANNFYKINPKTKKACIPYKPFWSGLPAKYLEQVENDFFNKTIDYLKQMGRSSYDIEKLEFVWPESSCEYGPSNLFGYIYESRHASEIDYALIDFMKIKGTENKIIVVPGTRPWECGTFYDKKSKTWHTFNGQNMLPNNYYPLGKEINKRPDLEKVLFQNGGTKKEFIERKKKIWDKYHRDHKPYKNYPCEGWAGADFYFYPVDMVFKTMSEYIPEIKYDVMRLEKFLCFYWS